MKKEEIYRRCEYCDKLILIESPPTKESYENGQIEIMSGTILLPKSVSAPSHRMESLDGIYCNVECLLFKIHNILGDQY